ncbi:MAG: energy-coupling factor ABC transporter ATP-binding protein [Magnetococcales bacterium]|nr:energy-coupling factor ABC transporter ATP-binding protein [Magnetococcales bacterium]
MTPPVPLMELVNLEIAFRGRPAGAALNVSVFPGERLALLGAEAGGKTVLLKVMAGLLSPTSGRVWWRGRDLDLSPPSGRVGEIGVLFREPDSRFLCATPREEITLTPASAGLSPEALSDRLAGALELAGLPAGLADRPWWTLSASQRYRGAVAVLYAMRPRLLLADEPGAPLSESGEADFARRLAAFGREQGMAVVVFTSRRNRATLFAERVVPLTTDACPL